jgi:hypothetical protein
VEWVGWSFPQWIARNGSPRAATIDVEAELPEDAWPGAASEVSTLAKLYVFSEFEAVRRFLTDAREVREVLFDAFPRISELFGEDTQMVLSVERDPEEDEPDQLFVLIRAGLSADGEAALARLAALDKMW